MKTTQIDQTTQKRRYNFITDEAITEKVRAIAKEHNIPLSRVINKMLYLFDARQLDRQFYEAILAYEEIISNTSDERVKLKAITDKCKLLNLYRFDYQKGIEADAEYTDDARKWAQDNPRENEVYKIYIELNKMIENGDTLTQLRSIKLLMTLLKLNKYEPPTDPIQEEADSDDDENEIDKLLRDEYEYGEYSL